METKMLSLHGVFPPIPTPFDERGDLALGALAENLGRWNEYDLSGYVVLGSNGEGVYLTTEEKVKVWQTVRRAVPEDKLVIAGTGCESTRQTIAVSQLAADAGADVVLVLTPHYYGGKMSPGALRRHFEAVAEKVPVPVMIYNMPRFTHIDMSAETILDIGRHPNVVGLKDSGGNVGKLAEIVGAAEDDLQVLAGSASFFFPGLAVGAVGGVMALANVAPQMLIDLYHHYRREEWREGAILQQRLVPLNTAVTSGFGVPGLKAALDFLGYYGGPVRSPLRTLHDAELETIEAIMVQAGVL